MENLTALLLDISSIQEYVFGSNKLKLNIGASYIVETEIWIIGKTVLLNRGKQIYIGGGNALFTFQNEQDARISLGEFTKIVLIYFPGLKVSSAIINDYNVTDEKLFIACRKKLALTLINNKSLYPSNPFLPKEGIFVDCIETNEYQETENKNIGAISNVANAKLLACKRAQELLNTNFKSKNYIFTDELEKLGQEKDKGYIAVVHIDGNNIGQQFVNCKSEIALKTLSQNVSSINNLAMNKLGDYVCELFSNNHEITKEIKLDNDNTLSILPFRPILNGGDDITFVSEGRLGIHLAEKFIQLFEKEAERILPESSDLKITACAGVAIVKTKFPFFKAYQLAEELCHEAKKPSRNKPGPYLSFHIANQGISGDLDTIRSRELVCSNGVLTKNPYSLTNSANNSLSILKLHAHHLLSTWPNNKIMEIRDVVMKSESTQELFKKQIEFRKLTFPTDWFWQDNKTIYWDLLQLLKFYPSSLLGTSLQKFETV